MGFIDGSVVSLAMPAIRADLGASLVDAQWISNAYMLFLSALVLLGGAAGDVSACATSSPPASCCSWSTSLACALRADAEMLIVDARGAGHRRGLHGAGQPRHHRQGLSARRAAGRSAIWAAFSSLTTAMGPFIGGMVLSFGADWMWRLIFAINVPIGVHRAGHAATGGAARTGRRRSAGSTSGRGACDRRPRR